MTMMGGGEDAPDTLLHHRLVEIRFANADSAGFRTQKYSETIH